MKKQILLFALIFCMLCCKQKQSVEQPPTLSASPPQVTVQGHIFDYDTTLWADVAITDSTILLDLKYATTDNFVGVILYDCPHCFLRPPAAKALAEANKQLYKKGLCLMMKDCYRPKPIQEKLWKIMPDARYVTPPKKGSMHSRGVAVDVTLADMQGNELDMGTPFDFFGKAAHTNYTQLPAEILLRRKLLRTTLAAVGFKHIRTEWWHYSYKKGNYPLSDMVWQCPK
ncbi:MAG: M15 family metallopeptidase [Saprospiraceae bacterium]